MDLTRKYRKTKSHLFQFSAVESSLGMSYNVSIFKWNFVTKQHEPFSLLSESSYDEMLSEPDLFFESILNDGEQTRLSIHQIVTECEIVYRRDSTTAAVMHSDLALLFLDREDVDKIITRLERLFMDYRI